MDCEEREEKVDEELPQDSDLESGGWLLPKESSMPPMTLRRVSRMVIPATVTFAVVMFMTSTMAKVVSINTSNSVAHGETSFLEEVIRMPPNPLKSAGEEDLMKALDSFLTMVGADLDDDLVEDPVTPGEISSRRLQGFGRKIRAGPWLKRAFKQASTKQQDALAPFVTTSCFQSAYGMVYYLGYIGLGIDQLTLNQTCPDTASSKACSGGVTNVLQNLAWLIIDAATVPAYCIPDFQQSQADNCFQSMTTFAGSGIEISSDGLNTVSDCAYLHTNPLEPRRLQPEATADDQVIEAPAPERETLDLPAQLPVPPALAQIQQFQASPPSWLGTNSDAQGIPGNRANTKALCAFQLQETLSDILTVATNLWAITMSCVIEQIQNQTGQETCAADVLAFIGSLPNVAQDISNLMQACPIVYPIWTPCAADAADIAQCALGVGAWAATVEQACR